MSTLMTQGVISLLATLGFENGEAGTMDGVVIDTFDQWSNPRSEALLGTMPSTCGFTTDPSIEAAA